MNKRQKRIRKNTSIAIAKDILKSRNLIDFDRQIVRLFKYGYKELPEEYQEQIQNKKGELMLSLTY